MISSSSARGATLEPCANTGSAAAIFDGGGGRCGCCFLAAQQVVRQTLSSCDRTERERISNSESSILNDFVEPSIVLQLKHPKFMVEKAVNSIEIGTAKHCALRILLQEIDDKPFQKSLSEHCRHCKRRLLCANSLLSADFNPFVSFPIYQHRVGFQGS
jgi:hypothetical protein